MLRFPGGALIRLLLIVNLFLAVRQAMRMERNEKAVSVEFIESSL